MRTTAVGVIASAVIGGAISWYFTYDYTRSEVLEAKNAGILEERGRWDAQAIKNATQKRVDERAREVCGADVERQKGVINVLTTKKGALEKELETLGKTKDAECDSNLLSKDVTISDLQRRIEDLERTQRRSLLLSSFSTAYSRLFDVMKEIDSLANQSKPGDQAVSNARRRAISALRTFEELRTAYREMEKAANGEMANLLDELVRDQEDPQPKISIYDLRGRLAPLLEGQKSRELLLRNQIQELDRIANTL